MLTIPEAPTNLQATPGNGQLTLTWSPSAGATRYRLYFSTQPAVSKTNGTLLNDVTSPYLHQALTNGTAYYYVVTASNAAGESADSTPTNGIPAVPAPGALSVVLTRPNNDERGVAHDTAIVIRLNKPIDGATVTASTVMLTGPSGPVTATVPGAATTAGADGTA